jgi:hypothetical protein
MFGHGQVAGLREKYGMEFRAPRLNEPTDHGLVERHRREIAPLLRDRADFASSARFRLFTLRGDDGSERPDVIVYGFVAGQSGASVVAFNNSPHHVAGRIDVCEPYADVDRTEGAGEARSLPILHALGLDRGAEATVVATLHPAGQSVDWRVEDLDAAGLPLVLGPYEYRVYRGMRRGAPAQAFAAVVTGDTARPAAVVGRAGRSSVLAGRYGSAARRAAARRRRG